MALCEILGISLNEFIAGEDIEPAEVVQKSEKNLIQVTEDGEHRKRKLKKIIVLLAVFGSVMAGILIYLLTFKNQPRVNYIEPLAQDSTEMNIAGMLSDARAWADFVKKRNDCGYTGFSEFVTVQSQAKFQKQV